ncbi:hypothetical protein ACTHQF_14400 [Pedobacter sp. SAFR-022]|uniref:hypothetical protein n=1 Tax=Pedobacter sp. SAFR-022 TaxID=3436861 RepID=UPI003F7FA667
MKIKLLLLLCIASLGLASCKKDTYIQDTPNRTIILTIQPNQWVIANEGRTITTDLEIPEIDQFNVDVEGILVYLDHPVNENGYIALPYTYSGNSYSFEHFNGGIAIDIQRSEFSTQNPGRPTVPIRVKVVLIPSVDIT